MMNLTDWSDYVYQRGWSSIVYVSAARTSSTLRNIVAYIEEFPTNCTQMNHFSMFSLIYLIINHTKHFGIFNLSAIFQVAAINEWFSILTTYVYYSYWQPLDAWTFLIPIYHSSHNKSTQLSEMKAIDSRLQKLYYIESGWLSLGFNINDWPDLKCHWHTKWICGIIIIAQAVVKKRQNMQWDLFWIVEDCDSRRKRGASKHRCAKFQDGEEGG